jgi:hypothetical protein
MIKSVERNMGARIKYHLFHDSLDVLEELPCTRLNLDQDLATERIPK